MDRENRVSETDAEAIIEALGGYTLPEQIGCLLSMIFSHVSAACDHDMAKADAVMQQVIDAIPHQWAVTKAAIQLQTMAPTGRMN